MLSRVLTRKFTTTASRRSGAGDYTPDQHPGSMTPFRTHDVSRFKLYAYFTIYACSSFWAPFLIVRYQLKKASGM